MAFARAAAVGKTSLVSTYANKLFPAEVRASLRLRALSRLGQARGGARGSCVC